MYCSRNNRLKVKKLKKTCANIGVIKVLGVARRLARWRLKYLIINVAANIVIYKKITILAGYA